jgi:hypothetical protein
MSFLENVKRLFHGNQTPGEYYRPEPITHSLGARGGGKRDANGNLLGKDGKVVGRNEAFYGGLRSSPGNSWLGSCGAYRRLTGRA